jgi:hypothetical protein
MVQQGLEDRCRMMDVRRVVAPSHVMVASTIVQERSMPLKMGQRKMVAVTF